MSKENENVSKQNLEHDTKEAALNHHDSEGIGKHTMRKTFTNELTHDSEETTAKYIENAT